MPWWIVRSILVTRRLQDSRCPMALGGRQITRQITRHAKTQQLPPNADPRSPPRALRTSRPPDALRTFVCKAFAAHLIERYLGSPGFASMFVTSLVRNSNTPSTSEGVPRQSRRATRSSKLTGFGSSIEVAMNSIQSRFAPLLARSRVFRVIHVARRPT